MTELTEEEALNSFFLEFLRTEYLSKKQFNKNYSLRAFSKKIGIDQSLLSKILNGKRKISKSVALQVSLNLGLSDKLMNQFFNKKVDDNEELQWNHYLSLSAQHFHFVSKWYHFAILELIKLKPSQKDYSFFAKKLGVEPSLISDAFNRLEELGYLSWNSELNKWRLLTPNLSWSNLNDTSLARKELQKETLNMAIESMESVSFEKRENGSLTVSCDQSLLPEIKQRMLEFRKELDAFIEEKSNKKNEVYQLNMAFYPLTKESI